MLAHPSLIGCFPCLTTSSCIGLATDAVEVELVNAIIARAEIARQAPTTDLVTLLKEDCSEETGMLEAVEASTSDIVNG